MLLQMLIQKKTSKNYLQQSVSFEILFLYTFKISIYVDFRPVASIISNANTQDLNY